MKAAGRSESEANEISSMPGHALPNTQNVKNNTIIRRLLLLKACVIDEQKGTNC